MDYIVKASDLFEKAKEILEDGMDYVVISLEEGIPPEIDPDDPAPPAVRFQAFRKKNPYGWTDFDELPVIEPSE